MEIVEHQFHKCPHKSPGSTITNLDTIKNRKFLLPFFCNSDIELLHNIGLS